MALPPSDRRRPTPKGCQTDKRRWRDDPDLTAAMERQLLPLGRDVYAIRQWQEWTQDEYAEAAGVASQTVLSLYKADSYSRLSTLVLLAYAAGYELDIRFRKGRGRSEIDPLAALAKSGKSPQFAEVQRRYG